MSIHERIRAARVRKGMSMEQLAQAVSNEEQGSKPLSWQTVQQWEKGTAPRRSRLEVVARVLGMSVQELATGEQSAPREVERASHYLPGFETLSIPVLAQAGSMGHGEDQMHDEIVIGRLTVSPEWALKTLKPTKLENLRFIHGYGDSMAGTFADGDILLVDSGVTDPKIDGVYVLEANQRIYIKRVRQRMDGAFEISSDNPNVKTVDVLDGRAQVTVHGRVIWAWNGKKM